MLYLLIGHWRACERLCLSRSPGYFTKMMIIWMSFLVSICCFLEFWRINPGRHGLVRWTRWLIDEAFRMIVVRLIKNSLTCGINHIYLAIMNLVGSHQSKPRVMVLTVVPLEIFPAELLCILNASKSIWEFRLVFHSLELCLRKRIII